MHITIGSTGAKLRKFGVLYPNSWTKKFIPKTFGYGRITVANSTALHFEFVQAGDAADPEAGKVLDEVWITKDVTEAVSSLDPRKSTYLRETSRAS